jgi:hypothetical protein
MKSPFSFSLILTLLVGLILPLAPTTSRAADLSITATSVAVGSNARTIRRTAGVAITAGKAVYLESSSNTLKLADCDNATAEVRKAIGIAVTSGAVGSMIQVVSFDQAFIPGATLTKGTVYILSATAGGIAPLSDLTTGWYGQVLFIANSTSEASMSASGPAMTAAN